MPDIRKAAEIPAKTYPIVLSNLQHKIDKTSWYIITNIIKIQSGHCLFISRFTCCHLQRNRLEMPDDKNLL